jgi:hypothetical protein
MNNGINCDVEAPVVAPRPIEVKKKNVPTTVDCKLYWLIS